jgi:hypothetical protein
VREARPLGDWFNEKTPCNPLKPFRAAKVKTKKLEENMLSSEAGRRLLQRWR